METFKSFIGFEENENLDEAKQSSPQFVKGNLYNMSVNGKITKGYFVTEVRNSFGGDSSFFAIFRVKGTGTKNPAYVGGRVFSNKGVDFVDDDIEGLVVAAMPGVFDDNFEEFLLNPNDSTGKTVGMCTSHAEYGWD